MQHDLRLYPIQGDFAENLRNKHVAKKYSDIMRKLYVIYKRITRLELSEISGRYYDILKGETKELVSEMKKIIEKRKK